MRTATMSEILTPEFLDWQSAGFGHELVRLSPWDDIGQSPGKKPIDAAWQTQEVNDGLVQRWARTHSNVGLRTRLFPCVDIDVDDVDIANACEQATIATLGSTARRTRRNSARRALLYRVSGTPFPKKALRFALPAGGFAKVEILAYGQQMVVAGMHPSGVPNEWPGGQPTASDLPCMSESQRDALLESLSVRLEAIGCRVEGRAKPAPAQSHRPPVRPYAPADWSVDAGKAEEALRQLDPDMPYDDWVKVGMALHAKDSSEGGPAFSAWDEWSSGGQKYPGPDELARKWRTFDTSGGVHFASLLAMAGVSGRRTPRPGRAAPAATKHTEPAHVPDEPEPVPPPDLESEESPEEIPLIRACDAEEKPVDWVVKPFLAKGELTDLSGDPGVGKGGITASWAAKITSTNPDATVIFFATEDPLGRVKGRLRAEGADLSRVLLLDISKPNASPILPGDITKVEELVIRNRAALLIVDPALEFMAAELDSHKQQDVARFMGSLLGVAQRAGAAVLTVRHNNKNAGASAIHRASGSIGFTGKARIQLLASKNQDTGERAIAMIKNNLGEDKYTVAYSVVAKDGASAIAWGECLAVTADELVNQQPGRKERPGPAPEKLEAAADLLRDILSRGPMHPEDVIRCAASQKVGRTTIYEAKALLGVRKVTLNLRVAWALPENVTPDGLLVNTKTSPDNSGFSDENND